LIAGQDFTKELYSLEAEMCTLGSMILSYKAAEEIVTIVSEEDFYSPAHRQIFRAIRQLLHNNKPVDLVTLPEELAAREMLESVGGTGYLVEIQACVPSASNATHYAGIVSDRSTLRRLESAGREIVGLVHSPEDGEADEKVDAAEQLVFEVGRKRLGRYFTPLRSLAKDFFVDVDDLMESGTPVVGIPTKFYDLDAKLTGLYGGDLTIIAARPSMGKTSLVLNIALQVAKQGVGNVAVFSLEMTSKQLVRRMVATESRISSYVLRRPGLSPDDYQRLADACEELYELPVFIDDGSDVSALEIRGKCRRLKADGGLALIVVDYLQLMRGSRKTENRVQEIGDIARSLKALSKELEVPVIALSQLNRTVESRENKRPQLADIRESGSIEAEADVVMFIYRDEYYKAREKPEEANTDPDRVEEAEIIIAKHRNGEVGTVKLAFQPKYATFSNLSLRKE